MYNMANFFIKYRIFHSRFIASNYKFSIIIPRMSYFIIEHNMKAFVITYMRAHRVMASWSMTLNKIMQCTGIEATESSITLI
jgi:hypothetical protein